jgi:hypothetical protein
MFSKKILYRFDYEIINLNLSNLFRNSKFCRKNNSKSARHSVRTTYICCPAGFSHLIFIRSFAAINSFIWEEKIAQKACHE